MGAILDATERLLSRTERLTARGIAQLAGVSVGTLYQYFPAKEAAVAQVVDRRLADDERRMLAVFESLRTLPLAAAVRAVVEEFVPKSQWERALYPRLVDTLESTSRLEPVQRLLSRFDTLLSDELRKRKGELAEGLDPDVAATVILYSVRASLFSLARRHPELPRESVVEELCRLSLNYLLGADSHREPTTSASPSE